MSQTIKIIFVAIFATLIIGGGIYFWQQTKKQSVIVDRNWLTYTSDKGFRVSYPSNWELSENSGNNADLSVVNLSDPKTGMIYQGQQFVDFPDLSIYYYPTILDEPENPGATTLDELVEKTSTITKIGDVEIGGLNGVGVIWGGKGAYYTILVSKNSHLYKIQFSDERSEGLTDIEKEISSSFEFTD